MTTQKDIEKAVEKALQTTRKEAIKECDGCVPEEKMKEILGSDFQDNITGLMIAFSKIGNWARLDSTGYLSFYSKDSLMSTIVSIEKPISKQTPEAKKALMKGLQAITPTRQITNMKKCGTPAETKHYK